MYRNFGLSVPFYLQYSVSYADELISGSVYNVPDSRLSSSSELVDALGARCSRILSQPPSGCGGAWAAHNTDTQEWLQVIIFKRNENMF